MATGIPDGARRLIAREIDSVEKLEVLLFLRSGAARAWTPDEVSASLRSDPTSVLRRLEALAEGGLAQVGEDGFRYAAAGDDARDVADLAECYAKRRHSVISLIFGGPDEGIRSFSDAFRLRRDE